MNQVNATENPDAEKVKNDIQELFQEYVVSRVQQCINGAKKDIQEKQGDIEDSINALATKGVQTTIRKTVGEVKESIDTVSPSIKALPDMVKELSEKTQKVVEATVVNGKEKLINKVDAILLAEQNGVDNIDKKIEQEAKTVQNLVKATGEKYTEEIRKTEDKVLEAVAGTSTQIDVAKEDVKQVLIRVETGLQKACTSEQMTKTAEELEQSIESVHSSILNRTNSQNEKINSAKEDVLALIQKTSEDACTKSSSQIALLQKLCSADDDTRSALEILRADLYTGNQSKREADLQNVQILQNAINNRSDEAIMRLESRITELQQHLSTRQKQILLTLIVSGIINLTGIITIIIILLS